MPDGFKDKRARVYGTRLGSTCLAALRADPGDERDAGQLGMRVGSVRPH